MRGLEPSRGSLGDDRDTSTQTRTFREHNGALGARGRLLPRKKRLEQGRGGNVGLHSILPSESVANARDRDVNIVLMSNTPRPAL